MSSTCSNETRPETIDLYHTTKAFAKWKEEDTIRYLTKPDPKTSAITVSARFNWDAAFFELGVPVKLKGLEALTIVYLRLCASTIISLQLAKNPTVPNAIGEVFQSTVLSLDFTLNSPPSIIAQVGIPEPLCPARKLSGSVVDAIRDLSNATTLSICIEARDAPPQLQSVSDGVSHGKFESFRSTRYDIASLYGGLGGKVITPSEPAPPTYDEAASSPPPPPPIEPSRKRLRQDSSTDTKQDGITLLWAEIRAMKESHRQVEVENSTLKQQNTELVTSMETLRQQNKELVDSMANLQEQYDALESRHAAVEAKTDAFEDTYDVALVDLREEMRCLDGVVKYLQDGQVGEETMRVIKSAVVDEIMKRLANG